MSFSCFVSNFHSAVEETVRRVLGDSMARGLLSHEQVEELLKAMRSKHFDMDSALFSFGYARRRKGVYRFAPTSGLYPDLDLTRNPDLLRVFPPALVCFLYLFFVHYPKQSRDRIRKEKHRHWRLRKLGEELERVRRERARLQESVACV